MPPPPPAEPAYLTLVRWPEKMDQRELVAALAEEAGLDPFAAGQRLAKKTTPAIIHRVDSLVAKEIVGGLRSRGVPVVAPTISQLKAFAPPIRAKRLAPAVGAPEPMYLCEPWRDEAFGFLAKDIAIMVRARLGRIQKSAMRTECAGASYEPITGTVIREFEAVQDVRTSISDILDIYLRDRRRIRCSGDKFNFDVLGASRGYSDNENMDKLSVMLAESAPHAIVDLGFSDFTAPPGVAGTFRAMTNGASIKDESPMFDFYSPWIVWVHAAMARIEK